MHARATVVDHLQKMFKGKRVAILCIFCNYKEQSTQSLENLISSVLKQIIQDQSFASESIKAFCRNFRDKQKRPRFTDLKEELRLVMCMAWLQAKGQAKPGHTGQAKPSQKCWPEVGFGLAWTFQKPKPMAQAMALSIIF